MQPVKSTTAVITTPQKESSFVERQQGQSEPQVK